MLCYFNPWIKIDLDIFILTSVALRDSHSLAAFKKLWYAAMEMLEFSAFIDLSKYKLKQYNFKLSPNKVSFHFSPREMFQKVQKVYLDLQDSWRDAASRYKQQSLSSRSLVTELSSVEALHENFSQTKSGNCAWSNLSNCQEFNSNNRSCWWSVTPEK